MWLNKIRSGNIADGLPCHYFLQWRWLNKHFQNGLLKLSHLWVQVAKNKDQQIRSHFILTNLYLKREWQLYPPALVIPVLLWALFYFCVCHKLCGHLAAVNSHHRAPVTSLRISACYSKYHSVIVSLIEVGPKRIIFGLPVDWLSTARSGQRKPFTFSSKYPWQVIWSILLVAG